MVTSSQSKPKHLFLLLGSLVFLFSLTYSSVQALIISQIFFDEFNIEKSTFDAGGLIKGDFTIWNAEGSVVPDIAYRFSLSAKDEQGNFTVIWDDQPSGNNFSLLPDQTLTKNFNYQLPGKLAPGEYEFSVQLYNSKGTSMAWKNKSIIIYKTEGGVLDLQKGSFLKNGERLGTEVFSNFGEAPKISFDVANKSFFIVKAYPKVAIYKESISGDLVKEIKKDFISLSPGEARNQEIDLTALSGSNSYIARVIMYDQDNNPVSNIIDFRWTILNEGGAGIIEIKTDKSSYGFGEEAKISVDLGTQNEAVQKGGISIKITDGKEVVGQAKQEVDLKTGKVDVWVPITKEVSDPGIEIVVTDKQNGILDQYPVKIETGGDEGSEKKQSSASWQIIGGSIFAGLAVVIAVIIFFMKRKKSAAGIMIFIFVSAGLFLSGAGIAKAEERIVGSWQEISSSNVVFKPVAPSPKSIYYLDGLVGFEGGIDSESFENSQFEFFIGDLNDPILKTENGIKMIDIEATRAKGYKIESLGTTTGYTKGGELRYKKFPKIPINDSYLGRARFYVQFKGDRVYKGSEVIWLKDSWQWEVAFVEATVQKSTEGGLYIDFGAGTVSAQKGETVNYNISLENSAACNAFSIDVMMIIDRSGSMDGKPLADAKDAANKFVKMLNPATDQIGLVAYDTISSLSSPLTENFSSVEDAINSITVADSTCISCGIGTANKELDERKRAEAVQYEVLMTDGQANTCISSCPSGVFQEAINEAKISGAKIFTVGFGPDSAGMPPKNCGNVLDSSCALLNIIASNTGGTYSYATNGEELSEIYKAIAGSMIGQSFGTKVTVEIPDEYFSLKKDGLDKRCNFDGKSLVCNIGFLDCLDKQAPVDPIEFQVEVKADAPDGDVITKAIISNQINQEKAISFKLKISSNKPDAKFSCDPSGCDIDGCSSPDCCRCYNDKNAVLKLINKSTPQGGSNIVSSIWSIKEQGSASYRDIITGSGIENCSPQSLAVGKHTVKLKVVNEKGDEDETIREVTYLQGAKAGFSCSLDKGVTWYDCEDKTHIYPNQGATIWLSDNQLALDHLILSDGAIAANVERDWYMVDADGNKTSFNTGKNNSTVSMVLNRLPVIIGMELNDKNRPPISKEHKINVVALPGWKEISPF